MAILPKSGLVAAVLSAGLVLSIPSFSAAAQEQPAAPPLEPLPAWSDGVYFMWNWDLGDSANPMTDADFGVDLEGSLGTGFGFGYRLAGMLRLEGELHAQEYWVGSLDLGPGAPFAPLDYSGSLLAFGAMANLFVDLPPLGNARPYLGAGYGFSRVEAEYSESVCIIFCFSTDNKVVDDWDLAEAWQAMAGIAFWNGASNSELYVGYRYFETDDLEFRTNSGTPFIQEGIRNHTLSIGMRFLM